MAFRFTRALQGTLGGDGPLPLKDSLSQQPSSSSTPSSHGAVTGGGDAGEGDDGQRWVAPGMSPTWASFWIKTALLYLALGAGAALFMAGSAVCCTHHDAWMVRAH